MKKKVWATIAVLAVFCILFSSCGGGPLNYLEVVGDYGDFECDENDCVWPTSDGGKYVSIEWSVTDSDNCIVTFKYVITDDNIDWYDEDFWVEYHEAGFENPEDALEEYMYDIADAYELPPEGDYKYERNEKKLVSVDYGSEYFKRD